jgi:hypothetical protein
MTPFRTLLARAEVYAAVCGQLAARVAARRYAIEQRGDPDPVTGPGIGVGYRLLTELEDALSGASDLLAEVRRIIAQETPQDA